MTTSALTSCTACRGRRPGSFTTACRRPLRLTWSTCRPTASRWSKTLPSGAWATPCPCPTTTPGPTNTLELCRMARQAGFYQYEISNFAKPGRASRHNLKYWTLQEYLGLGPAAHSYFGNRRFGFVRDLKGLLLLLQRAAQASGSRALPAVGIPRNCPAGRSGRLCHALLAADARS